MTPEQIEAASNVLGKFTKFRRVIQSGRNFSFTFRADEETYSITRELVDFNQDQRDRIRRLLLELIDEQYADAGIDIGKSVP